MRNLTAKNIALGKPDMMRPGKMRKMPSQAASLGSSIDVRSSSPGDAASRGKTLGRTRGKDIGDALLRGASWKASGSSRKKIKPSSNFRKFHVRSQ